MLNIEELEDIIKKVKDSIDGIITLANRTGNLDELLNNMGLASLLHKKSAYETEKNGKIVVIGQSKVKKEILVGIINKLGLDKNRFEFCLDYNESKTYNYKKLRYSPKYRVVMFGPVPHSSVGKNDSSSVIAEMKNEEGYPCVRVLDGSNGLKITKTNFKKELYKLIEENYI